MEKFQENLNRATKHFQIADHMAYITFPLINERRLLLKIFDEIYKSIINCIEAILNYEYLYKRIVIYKDSKDNMQTFTHKLAKDYSLNHEQIKKIREILDLNKRHKQSAIEFVKKDKVVIMSDNLTHQIIDIHIIKQYLFLTRELIMKANSKMNK